MAFPAKTSPDAIRSAALDLLERAGEDALTVRGVAAALGLAPNALYRHYPGHEALRAAVADDGIRALLDALQRATRRSAPRRASPPESDAARAVVRGLARAYLAFAQARPALYAVVMARYETPAGVVPAHDALWAFVVECLAPLTGVAAAPAAAVTLWAFLHGMVGLDRAELLGGAKPRHAAEFGLEAFLTGLAAREALTA